MMNNIDFRSGRMEIETYIAKMTAKYSLRCSKLKALKFNRKDILQDPVDLTFSYYMCTSSSCYQNYLKTKRGEMLLKNKSVVEKSVFKSHKEEKKGNCTLAGH